MLQDRRRRPNAVEEGQEDVVDLPPPAFHGRPDSDGLSPTVVAAPGGAPSPVLVVVLVGTGSLTLALAGRRRPRPRPLPGLAGPSSSPRSGSSCWCCVPPAVPPGCLPTGGRDASMASLNAGWSSMMAADSASKVCPSRIREASRWERSRRCAPSAAGPW